MCPCKRSSYRTIKVDLYCGLSPEEAKMVGNLHNQRTTSKRMFFSSNINPKLQYTHTHTVMENPYVKTFHKPIELFNFVQIVEFPNL